MADNTARATPKPLKWYQAWRLALTPKPAAYDTLVNSPNASPISAAIWLAATSFVGTFAFVLVFSFALYLRDDPFQPIRMISFPVTLAYLIAAALAATLTHWIAKALGGQGSFAQLFYALAAFIAPLSLVEWGLAAVFYNITYILRPQVMVVSLAAPLTASVIFCIVGYQFVLSVLAVRAAHQVTGTRAAIVVIAANLIVIIVMIALIRSYLEVRII